MARALAASASRAGRKVSFFMRKGADILSKWVGEAERQLRLLFEEAQRQQPAIIFFDEIDGLAPVRRHPSCIHRRSFWHTFCTQMLCQQLKPLSYVGLALVCSQFIGKPIPKTHLILTYRYSCTSRGLAFHAQQEAMPSDALGTHGNGM